MLEPALLFDLVSSLVPLPETLPVVDADVEFILMMRPIKNESKFELIAGFMDEYLPGRPFFRAVVERLVLVDVDEVVNAVSLLLLFTSEIEVVTLLDVLELLALLLLLLLLLATRTPSVSASTSSARISVSKLFALAVESSLTLDCSLELELSLKWSLELLLLRLLELLLIRRRCLPCRDFFSELLFVLVLAVFESRVFSLSSMICDCVVALLLLLILSPIVKSNSEYNCVRCCRLISSA